MLIEHLSCVPGTIVRTLHVFIHLILTKPCEVDTIFLILKMRKLRLRLSNLPKVPQLVRSGARIWPWAVNTVSPSAILPLQQKRVLWERMVGRLDSVWGKWSGRTSLRKWWTDACSGCNRPLSEGVEGQKSTGESTVETVVFILKRYHC